MTDVLEFPSAPPSVSQADLERLVALRAQAKALESECSTIEKRVRAAIEAGARIEPGLRVAYLRECHRDGYAVEASDYKQLVVR
jgi:hypothetical protein